MADEPTIHHNTSGEWVKYLQDLLVAAGYSVPQSGDFDDATLDAVHQVQDSAGLSRSEEVDAATWAAVHVVSHTEEAPASDPAAGPWPECNTVKVWLKAFIPGDAPGTIDGVGVSSGHRLLQGPISWFNDCFYTDTRGFSSNIGASCRLHSEIVINAKTGVIESEVHYCGTTHEADCEDGDIECERTAGTGGMHFSNLTMQGNYITIDLAGAAGNPCFTGAPDIDYLGKYTIDLQGHTVSFQGMVNGFPAYESYAAINGGAGHTIFNYGPSGTPGDLAGDASEAVSGTVSF